MPLCSPKRSVVTTEGAEEVARHRPATSQREELVDVAHVAESRRGPPTRKLPLGPGTNLLRRAGIIDLRSAQYAAWLSVFSRRYVGRSFEAESREARARFADARVLLSQALRSLGRPRDQCRPFRRINRAVEGPVP